MKLIAAVVVLSCSMLSPLFTRAATTWPRPHDYAPRRWTVLGPLPWPKADAAPSTQPANDARPSLDIDLLASIGGERDAKLDANTKLTIDGQTYSTRTTEIDDFHNVDLRTLFNDGETDFKIAYAYAETDVPEATTARANFGSDDSAAVWLNGQRVHRVVTSGRPINVQADTFDLPLRAGTNRLLVKVDNGLAGWGFALRAYDEEGRAQAEMFEARRNLEGLEPAPRSNNFLLKDEFPQIIWRLTDATAVFDKRPIKVRWFDPDLNEVQKPTREGRYTAVIEATTADGYVHRRMLTFAKLPVEKVPWFGGPPFREMPAVGVLPDRLRDVVTNDGQRAEFSRQAWAGAARQFAVGEGAAVAALAIAEMREPPTPPRLDDSTWLNNGFVRNAEHQLRLRMKLDGRVPKSMSLPEVLSSPAPELRGGNESEAGVEPGTVQKLRAFCEDWLKEDPNGFVVLVARRGVVFMHEGFGGFEKDTPFYPASIGKAIGGFTFARAVDQGLFQFDQPVADVFPEWKSGPPNSSTVTFRHCFNHVAGLPDHTSHGGLFNAYLDNALLTQDVLFVRPGTVHHYNGDSYDLAGKALELTTGRSIWRLIEGNLVRPFDEPTVAQYDMAFGDAFKATYLAKVGQMLLQDGQYGKHRFYSPGFVKSLLPKRVADSAPNVSDKKLEWGIGLTWMIDPEGPREKGVLGPNVVGHGAASATAWRVDLDHQLVIVIGRNRFKTWGGTAKRVEGFAKILAEGLEP